MTTTPNLEVRIQETQTPERKAGPGRVIAVVLGACLAIATIGYAALMQVDLVIHSVSVERNVFTGIRAIRVDAPGSVNVHAMGASAVLVQATLDGGIAHGSSHLKVVDGVLTITGTCPLIISPTCDVSYDLAVPRSTLLTLHGSDIVVSGTDGGVTAISSSGVVRLRDVSGQVLAQSSAGEVIGDELRAGYVRASSSAGDVRLSFAVSPRAVTAHSSAGDVVVQVPPDSTTYRVTAHTSAGSQSVSVRTSPDAASSITATSSAGDVRVEYR